LTTFAKGAVAVEVSLDLREGDSEVKLVRLDQGRKPAGHETDETGRRIRAHLTEILLKRGLRGFGFGSPQREAALELRRILTRHAALLREHLPEVFEGSSAVLD
jgi:hypothetical protein